MVKKLVFVALATAIVLPAAAFAQLSKDDQKCIDKYNNFNRLVSQQAGKDYRKCVKDAGKNKVTNPDSCVKTDVPGKIAGKASKVTALYPGCAASPIQQGAATAITAHTEGVQELTYDLFDDPVTTAIVNPGKDAAGCADKAILDSTKAFTAIVKEHRTCKKNAMKAGTVTDSTTLDGQCGNFAQIDGSGKAAAALAKISTDVTTKCGTTTLATIFPGLDSGCHAGPSALGLCLQQRTRCNACLTLNTADGQNIDCDLFDDGNGSNGSCGAYPPILIGNHKCTLGGSISESFMQLHAALPLAAFGTAGASIDFTCGTTGANGKAPCNCSVQTFPPLLIAGIFWACVNPPTGTCPAGEIDCNGGNAMGLNLVGNHNIGPCTSNADCASQCTTKCATTSSVPFGTNGGQCEGFCTDGAQSPCTLDSQCLALGQGSCNGPDGAGFGNICDCTCLADSGGPAGAAGELSCQLAFNLTVEPNPGNGTACDGADTSINVGPACAPLTTASSSGIINNANNGGGTFPAGGPFSDTGAAANCTALPSSTLTGVRLVGSSVFYGSTIGDIDAQIGAKCN